MTVDDSVFSAMESMNVKTALAWSTVLVRETRSPAGFVSDREDLSSLSSLSASFPFPGVSSRGTISFPREMGRTLSSSSRTMQSSQEPRERIKRSLKRATTESWDDVRYRAWTSCRLSQSQPTFVQSISYHCHCVQLLQRSHRLQQQNN